MAIKTIKKCKIETEADLIRIRREIQIMSSVQHPNIIHIYEGNVSDTIMNRGLDDVRTKVTYHYVSALIRDNYNVNFFFICIII